ncbi:HAD hydrolase-like protein [Ochrobactrum teleogrylli]
MKQYSALIFDLDGTLIDSAPDITAAVNVYMVSKGWPALSVEYVETFIGNGPRRLLKDIFIDQGLPFDDATVDAAVQSYIENYHRNPAEKTRFFSHVREDLQSLHAAGFRLGICTNKPHALTSGNFENPRARSPHRGGAWCRRGASLQARSWPSARRCRAHES